MFHFRRPRIALLPSEFSIFALTLALILTSCSSPSITTKRKLSPAERSKRAHALFKRWDENKDGSLSRDEIRRALEARALLGSTEDGDLILGMRKNKSDQPRATPRPLTQQEIAKAIEEAFKLRDADLNGRLTEEEFKKVLVERPADDQEVEFWETLL